MNLRAVLLFKLKVYRFGYWCVVVKPVAYNEPWVSATLDAERITYIARHQRSRAVNVPKTSLLNQKCAEYALIRQGFCSSAKSYLATQSILVNVAVRIVIGSISDRFVITWCATNSPINLSGRR